MMDLSKILSISGKPGLFKMVGQAKNGLIVESMTDGKRFPAFSHDKISSLEEISIFTNEGDLELKEVFKRIYEKQDGGKAIDPKSKNQQLKDFFEEIVPDYDPEQVYVSHIKKVVTWYNILQENQMLDFTEEEEESPEKEQNDEDKPEGPSDEEQESKE